MNRCYIPCVNSDYNKIRIRFWRTRKNGKTFYMASAQPCKTELSETGEYFYECYEPTKGYRRTLLSASRASAKSCAAARVELNNFITEAIKLLNKDGFTTAADYDFKNISNDIECEVH